MVAGNRQDVLKPIFEEFHGLHEGADVDMRDAAYVTFGAILLPRMRTVKFEGVTCFSLEDSA
jgi:hypothetical protein